METYHRRRYKNATQPNDEMGDTQMREQDGISGADTPPLVRHDYVPPPLSASAHCSFQFNDIDGEVPIADSLFSNIESIKVGSVYELDHIHLPPRTPAHLRSIRIAMVDEKTQLNVAVRFPSMNSLKTYFGNSDREMYPELDDKFVMGTVLAAKVLLRQVPSDEFAEKKHLEGFWLVEAASVDMIEDDAGLKKGTCLAELKCEGMVRWGIRRQVKFLERHQDKINVLDVPPSSSFVKASRKFKLEATKRQLLDEEEEEEEDEEEDEEEEGDDSDDNEKDEEKEVDEKEGDEDDKDISEREETMMEETRETETNFKRKRYKLRNNSTRQIAKKVKREKKRQKKSHGNKGRNKCRELLVLENPKDRWSAERYLLATKNLLEVMKAKGATATNPILRPDLRAEARKRIGDTGLLDHLLKHMAGKLAPGGGDRFRRRHNADGAMEYWLESADLVTIRKEAGVADPYWIPPPGWTPGDCPTQDPVCAKELRLLKEKISRLERNAQEMVTRKQYEEEIVKLRREIEQLVSSKKHKENEATEVLSDPPYMSQNLGQLGTSLKSSKAGLEKLLPSMDLFEELMVISDFVKGIEQEVKKLMTNTEGKTRSDSALMVSNKSCAEKEKKQVELEQKSIEQEVQEVVLIGDQEGSAKRTAEKTTAVAETTAEKKAAKIERLKSGFRICKPQGTFLWPSMGRNNYNAGASNGVSPQVVVQVEDLLVVPTPPSVSSSSALAPPQLPCLPSNHHQPPSPVKPIAERRAVTVTISTTSNDHGDQSYSTTTTTTTKKSPTSCFNLNDIPSINPFEGFSDNPSSQKTITTTTTTTVTPRLVPDTVLRREMINGTGDIMTNGSSGPWEAVGCCQKKLSKCSSSSASCLSAEVGNWLALATANSVSDESSQG